MTRAGSSFFMGKLHSLTGVLPIGCFLVLHLWTNAPALQGRQAFADARGGGRGWLIFFALELPVILLPLASHAVYGLVLAARAGWRVAPQSDPPAASEWLRQATELVASVFVVVHFSKVRWPVLSGARRSEDLFVELCASLSGTSSLGIPWLAVGYLVGLGAACYHLTHGLKECCSSWGLTTTERANRWAGRGFALLGLLLFALSANTVLYFATGAGVVLAPEPRVAPLGTRLVALPRPTAPRATPPAAGSLMEGLSAGRAPAEPSLAQRRPRPTHV